jgi:hypothetical protein
VTTPRPRPGPLVIAAAVLAGYARILLAPDALIVDLDRHQVDTTIPAVVPRVAGNDLTRLYLPAHRRVAAAVRREGRIPAWDPVGFGGRPVAANPQSGLWYPPAWILWTLDRPATWSWLTLAHLAWAGWGAYALARTLGLGEWAATLGGIAFALNPYMTAQVQAGHVPHVWSASWSGWAFAGLIDGLRDSPVGWLRLSAALALSWMAGHPQEAYLLGLAVLAWGAIAVIRARGRGTVGLLGSLAMATALSCAAWLPPLLALPESRHASGVEVSPTAYALAPVSFAQLAYPLMLGGPSDYRGRGSYAESQLAPGLGILALAAIALLSDRRRARPWLALILACWIIAAGRPLGVYSWLGVLPGFGQMRVPARTLFLAALGGSVLAAMGAAALHRTAGRKSPLAALAALELIALTWAIVRVTPTARLPGPDALDAAIARHRPSPTARVRAPEHLLGADRIDRLGLEVTDLYDLYQLARSAELYEALYAHGAPPRVWTRFDPWGEAVRSRYRRGVLDRMGVGLLLSGPGLVAPPPPITEHVATPTRPVTLHVNPGALPRAYVVPAAVTSTPDGWRLALAWLDPREAVLLEAPDPLPPGPRQPFTPATYRAPAADRVLVDVTTERPGLLVVTDAWAPGWLARLDEVEVPLLVADHAHRAVALPRGGRHRVEMRFEPPGLAAGLTISIAAWLTWFGTLVIQHNHLLAILLGRIRHPRPPRRRARPIPAQVA